MFQWVTSRDSVSLMSLEIGCQISHIRSAPSSEVPSSLKVLSDAVSCSSWDWHSPGAPESSLPLWLLWWGFCSKERSIFLSWVCMSNGKRNSQCIYKSFKFHYQSIASFGMLFGAESLLNIYLKVSGSPCQLCLCLVRIALCSLLHVTIPCFSQITLNLYVSYQSQPWLSEMPIYDRQAMKLLQITRKVFLYTSTLVHFCED